MILIKFIINLQCLTPPTCSIAKEKKSNEQIQCFNIHWIGNFYRTVLGRLFCKRYTNSNGINYIHNSSGNYDHWIIFPQKRQIVSSAEFANDIKEYSSQSFEERRTYEKFKAHR